MDDWDKLDRLGSLLLLLMLLNHVRVHRGKADI